MKIVSEEIIENVLQRMEDIKERDAPGLITRMGEEQPIVLAYLMAYAKDLTEDEQGLLVLLGLNIWQMMSEDGPHPAKVSEEVIEEMEDKNVQMVEYQAEEFEFVQDDIAERLITGYNQRNILMYMLESIMEEPEDERVIQGDNIGIFMLCLKTVIDCFDRDHLSLVD